MAVGRTKLSDFDPKVADDQLHYLVYDSGLDHRPGSHFELAGTFGIDCIAAGADYSLVPAALNRSGTDRCVIGLGLVVEARFHEQTSSLE